MSYIYDLDSKFYDALLATTELDIVDKSAADAVGEGKIPPDTHNRTILIGLGGTGVQTINHVKRVISSKLAPSWKNYIAFLAIDSDNNEFDNATHLTEEEFIRTTKPGIQTAVSKGKVAYPKAWLPFVDEDQARTLVGFDTNGAGRKRLMGKMKSHYKNSGSKGVDEEIVAKLAARKNNVLEGFPATVAGNYDVYVIGSVSGGTCSGTFLELPALIRKALNADERTQIHAMLYLPDTLTALDPAYERELMANGYASLKELDYFQGLKMREETEETFYYNDPASFKLKMTADNDFFTLPYLIGTRSGATTSSKGEACDTIAEFFISILGRMVPPGEDAFLVDSFVSNALNHVNDREVAPGNDNLELNGTDHSRPKRYGTVGFAQAAAPEQIVKAYTISQACKLAGLEPIEADERAARIAKGETLLPFYGADQFYPTMEVNDANKDLLAALNTYMLSYQAPRFAYATSFGGNPTWEEIRDGAADDMGRMKLVDNRIEEMTGSEAARKLKEEVTAQFTTFRNSVKAYVRQNGPMAFVNLFEGNAEKNEGAPRAVGIREILTNLRDDLDPVTQSPKVWPTAAEGKKAADDAKQKIVTHKGGFFGWAKDKINGFKAEQAGKWVSDFNAWTNIRINEKLRGHMLGTNGILNRNFIEPAEILCKQLETFGKLLSAMAKGYDAYGDALNDYDEFAKVNGGSAQVNIAALNHNVHAYLKEKAEKAARNVEAEKVRDALVNSFFDDPAKWVEYDEKLIERKGGGNTITLVNANSPVSARYEFDRCLRQTMPATVEIKVEELFNNANVNASVFANQIVTKLNIKSAPLFNGKLPSGDTHRYMMYPQSLKPELKTALENAARSMISSEMKFYGTDYADAIMMYQMVAPFEMYKLAELPEWENQYWAQKAKQGNGLHGRSPDLVETADNLGTAVYSEVTSWFDYPAITYNHNPKARDASSGEICHEGQVRIEMDKIIKEARKKGILYSHKTNNNTWVIKRVHLDKSIDWNFEDELLMPDEDTGLLPEGKELLNEIVVQNRKKIADVSKVVKLAYAGLLSKEHSSEEYAWEYASRVLYVHRPMFIDIRNTLEKVRPWFELVNRINSNIKKAWNPAKMYKLIQAGILAQSKNGLWAFRDERGAQVAIANMNPAKLEILRDSKPKEAAIVDAGLTLYYLFDKLMKKITDEELDEALERATECLNDDEYSESDEFLTANKLARTTLNAELETVKALGADLEDFNKPKSKFVNNLKEAGLTGKEQPVEIAKFYNKIQLWKVL